MTKDDKFSIMSSNNNNFGYKLVIDNMNLIICTKQFFDKVEFAY